MLPFLLLASSLCRAPTQKPVTSESVRDILVNLIERTNGIRAFVAEYRVHVPGEDTDSWLRLAYEAPEKAVVEIETPEGTNAFRMQNGVIDARMSAPGGKPGFMHLAMKTGVKARCDRIAAALRSEFPGISTESIAVDGMLPKFELTTKVAASSDARSVNFLVGSEFERRALLAWLSTLQEKDNGRLEEGDRPVFVESDGTKLVLSTRTGFVERIEKPKEGELASFTLEALDLDPDLEHSDFEVPALEAGAEDSSQTFARLLERELTLFHRRRVFSRVRSEIADGKLEWDLEVRDRLKNVLTVLHSDGLAGELASWIANTREWIEHSTQHLRGWAGDRGEENEVPLDVLEQALEDLKKPLEESIGRARESYPSSLTISSRTIPDPALRESFLEVEKSAIEAAIDRSLRDPLSGYLEERIQAAIRKD